MNADRNSLLVAARTTSTVKCGDLAAETSRSALWQVKNTESTSICYMPLRYPLQGAAHASRLEYSSKEESSVEDRQWGRQNQQISAKRTTGSTTTNETRLENKNKGDLRLPFVVVHRSFPVAH